jgi:hypothetical protein
VRSNRWDTTLKERLRRRRPIQVAHSIFPRAQRALQKERAMADAIWVASNTRAGWRDYARTIDYVPDPMTLRTAELFFNGKSGCVRLQQSAEQIWEAIDRNLHGLLTFVDMLLTRKGVPLIAYNATYRPGAAKPIDKLVGKLAIPVNIDGAVYAKVHRAAVDKLKTLDLTAIPEQDVMDVIGELTAFAYDWEPDLLDFEVKDENTRRIARFILGGLIFGWYAEASETDHLIQTKRSRLFAALTKPDHSQGLVTYQKEAALFEELRRTCLAANSVRFEEIPPNPTVLPYVLLGAGQSPETVAEVLDRVLKLRESGLGRDYRTWFKDLRKSLSLGQQALKAKKEIEAVRVELEQRLRGKYPKWSREIDVGASVGLTFSISVEKPAGPKIEAEASLAKLEGKTTARVGIPDWIRNWLLDLNPFGRHRKLLLRAALSQAEYRDVMPHLRKIWMDS